MFGLETLFNNDKTVTIMIVIAVSVIAMMFLQPFFQKRNVKQRVKIISREVDVLKQYERQRMEKEKRSKQASLRRQLSSREKERISAELSRRAATISHNLNLGSRISDAMRLKLSQAGYRREEHAYNYILAKIIGFPVGLIIGWYMNNNLLNFEADTTYLLSFFGFGILGFMMPNIIVKNQRDKRKANILKFFPDALDLIIVCVQSGMTLETALRRVATEIELSSEILAEEMVILVAELNYIRDRRVAYTNFAERCGLEQVKDFVTAVVQSEVHGTAILSSLRVQSEELRFDRIQRAEAKANALSTKLTVPLAFFMLPVVFIVVLTPGIANVLRSF